jgi:hypothetical protein
MLPMTPPPATEHADGVFERRDLHIAGDAEHSKSFPAWFQQWEALSCRPPQAPRPEPPAGRGAKFDTETETMNRALEKTAMAGRS